MDLIFRTSGPFFVSLYATNQVFTSTWLCYECVQGWFWIGNSMRERGNSEASVLTAKLDFSTLIKGGKSTKGFFLLNSDREYWCRGKYNYLPGVSLFKDNNYIG